jgi:hypothetical protein
MTGAPDRPTFSDLGYTLARYPNSPEIKPMRSPFTAMFLAISGYASGIALGADANVTSAEQTAVRNVLTAIGDAWNKHDAEAFSMVFADDADFTNVIGMSAHGRTEIAKFHAPLGMVYRRAQ